MSSAPINKKVVWLILVVAIVVLVCLFGVLIIANIENNISANTVNPTITYSYGKEIQNINYCNIDNYSEQMDIYLPENVFNNSNVLDPLVIYVHGGGWINGSKNQDWNGIFPMLLQNRFIVASINYFMPSSASVQYGFPLNVEDVACAVRYLRDNGMNYHIDSRHIGLLGDSAGGNLVSLEALSAMNGTFDNVGQYTGYSSQVQAVADAFGPANLTDPSFIDNYIIKSYTDHHLNLVKVVFGNNLTDLLRASPVNFVKAHAPPFLIEQGENDTTVPQIQSIQLYNRLQSEGDQAQLILVKNCEHEFQSLDQGTPISPSLSELLSDIVTFFNSTLN